MQNFNDEEDRDGEEGDLMGKFRRGGGELDLTQIGPVSAQFSTGAGSSSSSTPGGSAGNDPQDDAGTRSAETGSGASRKVDAFAEEAGDEEGEGERQAGGVGGGESMNEGTKKLEDLLWGHESWQCDGFDSSLEEQVEDR